MSISQGGNLELDFVLQGPQPLPNGTTIGSINTTSSGTPVLYWQTSNALTTNGCPGGTATFSVSATDGSTGAPGTVNGSLTETPTGSGTYTGTIPALYPLHGSGEVTITFTCPDPTRNSSSSFSIYIDPSGTVVDTTGHPIAGATVTLLAADSASGPFTAVPAGSAVMSPANRNNPDATSASGNFGWDVLAGYYEIQVSAPGCVSPSDSTQSTVTSAAFQVPPPMTNLQVVLKCNVALAVSLSPVSATEGATFNGAVGTLSGGVPPYTGSITWGDSSSSTATFVGPDANGNYSITGSHAYAEEGSYTTTVAVSDSGGGSVSASSTAMVNDAALTTSVMTVTPTEGTSFNGVVARFTDADPAGAAGDYSATINWGDSHSSPGAIAVNSAGGFTVSGTHTYAEEGSYPVSVAVSDAGGSYATVSSQANVGDAVLSQAYGNTWSESVGRSYYVTVGGFLDGNVSAPATDFSGTINWGDGTSTNPDITPATVVSASNGWFHVNGTHTYAKHGTWTVTFHVADDGGNTASASGTIKT